MQTLELIIALINLIVALISLYKVIKEGGRLKPTLAL